MMRDFYTQYYCAVETSQAHAAFCEYAYGKNLCQHGFMTIKALDFLLRVTGWLPRHRVLDIGCGNGRITQFLAERTGAQVYGMDFIPDAVIHAARDLHIRPRFFAADLNALPCAPHSFDVVVSIDSLYFAENYSATLAQWARCVKRDGYMAIFYSHGANPQQPKSTFDRTTLAVDKTPAAIALTGLGMSYEAWDFTAEDYELAQRKRDILTTLQDEFVREGNLSLYENRIGETLGVLDAVESGMHARYLYYVHVPNQI